MGEGLSWDEISTHGRGESPGPGAAPPGAPASLQTTALVLTALRHQRHADQDWQTVTWANRHYFFGARRSTGALVASRGAAVPPERGESDGTAGVH